MSKLKVLVACEFSGRVRDAFIRGGHNAMSCDLLPTLAPGPHYQGDVRDILNEQWDLLIAHPPCTYLCSSGLHWNTRRPERKILTEEAVEFARKAKFPDPKVDLFKDAYEGPARIRGVSVEQQYIQN